MIRISWFVPLRIHLMLVFFVCFDLPLLVILRILSDRNLVLLDSWMWFGRHKFKISQALHLCFYCHFTLIYTFCFFLCIFLKIIVHIFRFIFVSFYWLHLFAILSHCAAYTSCILRVFVYVCECFIVCIEPGILWNLVIIIAYFFKQAKPFHHHQNNKSMHQSAWWSGQKQNQTMYFELCADFSVRFKSCVRVFICPV